EEKDRWREQRLELFLQFRGEFAHGEVAPMVKMSLVNPCCHRLLQRCGRAAATEARTAPSSPVSVRASRRKPMSSVPHPHPFHRPQAISRKGSPLVPAPVFTCRALPPTGGRAPVKLGALCPRSGRGAGGGSATDARAAVWSLPTQFPPPTSPRWGEAMAMR